MLDWLVKFKNMIWVAAKLVFTKLGVTGMMVIVMTTILSGGVTEAWEKLKGAVYETIRDLMRQKTGLELDINDPLSDASIAAALSAKSGIELTTVMNRAVLIQELLTHASGLIQTQTGVPLTNLLSVEQIKADVVIHAENVVFDRTGLDIRGETNFDGVQKRIAAAVRDRLAEFVVARLRKAAEDFSNPEASLDDLLSMVYRAQEAKGLKVRDVALGTAAALVVKAYSSMSTPIKRRVDAYRHRSQNREAQRRFRARHGLRMRYEKVPKPAPVVPPVVPVGG